MIKILDSLMKILLITDRNHKIFYIVQIVRYLSGRLKARKFEMITKQFAVKSTKM